MKSKKEIAVKAVVFSILGNALLALIKGVVGVIGNSYALIADAIESTSDVFSSLLVFFGLRYSTKPADENHPYGHGRAEPLVTFTIVLFLVVSATIIAYQSIQHINEPQVAPEKYTLIVLAIIIIIKEISFRYVSKKSDETKSTSLKADAWHHRSDELTSLLAFLGISIAIFMGKGYETADDWAALLASILIVFNAYLIFRPALSEIMDENLYDDFVTEIKVSSQTIKGVLETEKCFVRKAGLSYHVDLHIVVDGLKTVAEGHEIAHQVKDKLKLDFPEIVDVLIHVEPKTV
jgi:cation diffusion facilitator family transporter